MTIEQFREALREAGFYSELAWDTEINHGHPRGTPQVRRITYLLVYGKQGKHGRPFLTGCIANQHPGKNGVEILWSSNSVTIEGDINYLQALHAARLDDQQNRRKPS